MAKSSRGLVPKCPLFKPTREGQAECLAEKDKMRFLVTRYKNGNLSAWRVPNRGPIKGSRMPISTPTTRSLSHLLDEAARYMRSFERRNPRA